MHLFLQAFTPEINLWESYPLLYVKPTIQKQPGQGHSVLSLQSNTDFPLKGKFSISKDLIVWSFKNNSRCLNFRTEYIPQHKIVILHVICTNFQSLGTAICFIFRYNLHSVFKHSIFSSAIFGYIQDGLTLLDALQWLIAQHMLIFSCPVLLVFISTWPSCLTHLQPHPLLFEVSVCLN